MGVRVITGDCRKKLRELPTESVHMCVTSPPYWGLRDYGIEGMIGLENSFDEWLLIMVDIFREVQRVLRKDGTLWLNIGDAYAGSPNGRSATDTKALGSDDRTFRDRPINMAIGRFKPKDLMMMPARLALTLQADGWWLRSEIIWAKPNPMPESVTDRPTSAHEKVYLLSKSPRYFYDAEAVREPMNGNTNDRGTKRNPPIDNAGIGHKGWVSYMTKDNELTQRNLRNVWTIATAPFRESHFATFPPKLVELCIKAGTSEKGVCAGCGRPWVREVERTAMEIDQSPRVDALGTMTKAPTSKTTGWRPSCGCEAAVKPATVLDPFLGAGTTGLVSDRLGRDCIGVELNPDYAEMARKRIYRDAPLFAEVTLE